MPHPIYALWCHPRSRSTAVERAMIERGDLEVVHEPFSVLYYREERATVPHLSDSSELPRSYEGICSTLLERAERGPVLFKEMAYHGRRQLLEDSSFLKRLTHAFLIRDPSQSIASHYAIDPELTLIEVGLEALWNLYARVGEFQPEPPVIDADLLAASPETTLEALGQALGLPPKPEAVNWRPGDRPEWRSWGAWHQAAAQSSGIHARSTDYQATVLNTPKLRHFLEHHMPYYQRLRALALTRPDPEELPDRA